MFIYNWYKGTNKENHVNRLYYRVNRWNIGVKIVNFIIKKSLTDEMLNSNRTHNCFGADLVENGTINDEFFMNTNLWGRKTFTRNNGLARLWERITLIINNEQLDVAKWLQLVSAMAALQQYLVLFLLLVHKNQHCA